MAIVMPKMPETPDNLTDIDLRMLKMIGDVVREMQLQGSNAACAHLTELFRGHVAISDSFHKQSVTVS